jgi:hypothetical protein
MKKYIKLACIAIIGLFVLACQEEDQEFGPIVAPTNLVLNFEIVGQDEDNPNGDGSGLVNFIATADNALSFRYDFGDDSGIAWAPNGDITHRFTRQGDITYLVTVLASGTGGAVTSETITIVVNSAFEDQEAKVFLAGGVGASKTWYPIDEEGSWQVGVGPTLEQDVNDDGNLNGHWFPQYDATGRFACPQELIFSLDEDSNLTYQLNNEGSTYFNWAHCGVVGESCGQFEDTCFAFDTSFISEVNLVPSSTDWTQVADPDWPEPRGTVMNFSENGFMGYYTGVSEYEILQLDNDFLYVRFYDSVNPVLAWYQRFTTTPPDDD